MLLDDGREVLARPVLPLRFELWVTITEAVAQAAQRLGYTDVVLLTDGPYIGAVAATPPARPKLVDTRKENPDVHR